MITGRVIQLTQGSSEWHEFRKNKVGASEIASILGLKGAFKTRKELLSERLNPNHQPEPENAFVAEMFADGHEWEEIVRNHLNKEFQHEFTPCVVVSKEDERFMASLDGYCQKTNKLIEIKSTRKEEYLKGDLPPTVYNVQMQWQFFCSGLQQGILAIVNAKKGDVKNGEIRYFNIERDDHEIEIIKGSVLRFLDQIEKESLFEQPKELESDDSELNEIANKKMIAKALKEQLDAIEDEIKIKAEGLLKKYNAFKIKGFGVQVEFMERVGAVEYAKIPELQNVNLEQYRKKPSRYVQVKQLKEGK